MLNLADWERPTLSKHGGRGSAPRLAWHRFGRENANPGHDGAHRTTPATESDIDA